MYFCVFQAAFGVSDVNVQIMNRSVECPVELDVRRALPTDVGVIIEKTATSHRVASVEEGFLRLLECTLSCA